MKYIKIIVLIFLSTHHIQAQLRLADILKKADDQNKGIQVAKSRVELSRMESQTAYYVPETQFSLQYGNIQNPNVGDYTVGANQLIINPLKNKNLKALYLSRVNEKEAEVAVYKASLHKTLRDLYYRAQYLNDKQLVFSEQLSLFSEIEKYAAARVNAGETDILEKISVESQIHQLQNAKNTLSVEYQSSLNQIAGWLNTRDSLLVDFDKGFQLISENPLNNPGISVLQQMEISAEKDVDLSKSMLKPDFNAGIFNQSMMGHYGQFFVSTGINIPLFNDSRKAKIESSRLNKAIIADEISTREHEINTRLQALKKERTGIEISIKNYRDQLLPEAKNIVDKAKLRYRAGEITYLEFYQMQLVIARLQEELETIWYNYHLNISEALWLIGE